LLTINLQSIETIRHIFEQIFVHQYTSDKVFEEVYKKNRVPDREKSIITKQVYSLLQNWRYLQEIQNALGPKGNDDFYVFYQIHCILNEIAIPESKIFVAINRNKVNQIATSLKGKTAIEYSVPDWLDAHCQKELGGEWPSICKHLNGEAPLVIRTNTDKISREKLQILFKEKGFSTNAHKTALQGLILKQKTNVFKFPEFQQGYFEIQDISSQQVGHFLNPQPGWRIIDACAGNGGKSLHLSNLMQNRGKIIALDIYQYKLDTLKKRARRAGSSIIETRLVDSTKVIKRLYGTADAVLLDVPCSGLGVLKRNPEIKWRLKAEDLENLLKTQEELLSRYSLIVKPGGKLVYSTCSILPSENAVQIQKFLTKTANEFELIREEFLSPGLGFDGFYMAELKRKS
jgi:16S rRNA (cytosine967-C5)-methyltransferase